AVHPGIGNGGDQVGRSRPAGGHADAHLTRSSGVALGGVSGALLVAAEDVVEPVGILGQRVVERHDRATRDAEDDLDALPYERFTDDLCSGSFVRHGQSSVVCGTTPIDTPSSSSRPCAGESGTILASSPASPRPGLSQARGIAVRPRASRSLHHPLPWSKPTPHPAGPGPGCAARTRVHRPRRSPRHSPPPPAPASTAGGAPR